MAECVVYWVYDKNCKNIETDGYVGISVEPDARLLAHQKNENFSKPFCMEILTESSVINCRKIERQLRPKENIGWNKAAGGGKPPLQTNQKQITCEKCGKVSNPGNHKQWHGDNCGRKRSAEEIVKYSQAMMGKNKGRTFTEEQRRRMSEACIGKKSYTRTPEQRAAISARQKGQIRGPLSEEHRAKIGAAHKGKKHPPRAPRADEVRKRISATMKGRKQTPEHVANVQRAGQRTKYNKKKIRFDALMERWKEVTDGR